MTAIASVAGATALVLGLTGSPAFATSESGGAFTCPSTPVQRTVMTYNYAAGTVYHQKMVGGIWDTHEFGTGLPPANRYWAKYFNVQGWLVFGTIQENENSGVSCVS